ncbi:thrombospondin type 3 repeat-containing protein [bacterium]|nr:thrombospondin type 3 repeat-containing protein [bacterium]
MKPDSIGKLDVIDPVLQKSSPPPPSQNLQVTQSFDGLGFQGANPSDVNADVGPNHLIQMVNGNSGAIFQVFDKSGNILTGPFFLDNYLGFPGGLGDPIVLYDQEADRWMKSEFASAGNHLHVAISQTNDPLGCWHIYIYDTPNFPDFPKFGIWNDAYIISVNEFSGGFVTQSVYALDRTKLLTGVANNAQRLTLPDNAYGFHYLPLDVDGAAMAPLGSSPLLIHMNANSIEIWKMDIDFSNPANTSASLDITVNIAPFSANTISVDQPNSTTNLAVLFLRMMNRGQYRNFGTHESMVGCFDVDASGGSGHGVRWFEFRKISGGSWTLFQEGTYAPDTDSRWMPSIAMNADSAIGLMYNVVNGTNIFPSIRYTGRSAADPLGIMTLPETEVATGTTNNGHYRYGDYYSVSVDPSNGSFWITGQYNPTNNWASRIAQFFIGPDTDNDGFVDAADNCPGIANPNQFNWDSDNFGAACDCDDTNAGNNSIVINDDPIVSGTYLANDSISSNGTVPNSATVIFQAGKSIELEPEFKALDGSDFTALIDGCDNSPVPDDIDMDGMLNVEDNCPYIPTIGLGFDGIDDNVEVPDADEISLVGDLTFEVWVKVTDFNNFVGILGKTLSNQPAPFDLYLNQNSGLPRLLVGDGNTSEFVNGTNAPAIGQWAHLAVIKNGNSITHYLNGASNGTGTITTIPADNNGTMIIGSRADLFTKMKGSMDELRIWNDARTITEINDNMNKELSGTEAGLVGYYRFNEGTPNADNTALNSIEDLSLTANHGTPTNFAKSGNAIQLDNWYSS